MKATGIGTGAEVIQPDVIGREVIGTLPAGRQILGLTDYPAVGLFGLSAALFVAKPNDVAEEGLGTGELAPVMRIEVEYAIVLVGSNDCVVRAAANGRFPRLEMVPLR